MEIGDTTAGDGTVPKGRARSESPSVENQARDAGAGSEIDGVNAALKSWEEPLQCHFVGNQAMCSETISGENVEPALLRLTQLLQKAFVQIIGVHDTVKGLKAELKGTEAMFEKMKTEMNDTMATLYDSRAKLAQQFQELADSIRQTGEAISLENTAVNEDNICTTKENPQSLSKGMKNNGAKKFSNGEDQSLALATAGSASVDSEEPSTRQDAENTENSLDEENVVSGVLPEENQDVQNKVTGTTMGMKKKKRNPEARKKEDMELALCVIKALKREGGRGRHQKP
ncbi:uncharacterized protein LOC125045626 [Penaeus chinensis]|uniref:uncharacterized protein LOC125045626 n=1 Tax=Penaeus chinensis TaxID=139456 RepID=UPI001FB8099B|nr:uncharacterized protein LOC125045626 [Penaeus chinensis]XP_047498971.1 uncharacterized protein LOC125045626 [Penaeus chinensis]